MTTNHGGIGSSFFVYVYNYRSVCKMLTSRFTKRKLAFYNHQFSCSYADYRTEFPASIPLVKKCPLACSGSITLRRP